MIQSWAGATYTYNALLPCFPVCFSVPFLTGGTPENIIGIYN